MICYLQNEKPTAQAIQPALVSGQDWINVLVQSTGLHRCRCTQGIWVDHLGEESAIAEQWWNDTLTSVAFQDSPGRAEPVANSLYLSFIASGLHSERCKSMQKNRTSSSWLSSRIHTSHTWQKFQVNALCQIVKRLDMTNAVWSPAI